MLRQNKGITLVALVITILVMLILASVSIALVVDDSGFYTNATKAADSTYESSIREQFQIAVSACQSDYLIDYYSGDTSDSIGAYLGVDDLQSNMNSQYVVTLSEGETEFTESSVEGDTCQFDVTYKEKTYSYILTITSEGKGATFSEVTSSED